MLEIKKNCYCSRRGGGGGGISAALELSRRGEGSLNPRIQVNDSFSRQKRKKKEKSSMNSKNFLDAHLQRLKVQQLFCSTSGEC
jgi:hypothetical protein